MTSSIALWTLCLCVAIVRSEDGPVDRLVKTPQGPVRGYKQPGEDVFVFYGIPYATVPKGPYKFKAPLPAPAWFSVFEAVNKSIKCPQHAINLTLDNTPPQEDCLVANIYVSDTEQKKLPVVVYVHGGAYQLGSGLFMEGKNLARSKKVIVVTFNYRVGIHGFLCLGTEDIQGNAGMKDQVALLRWVKKHIASYGGNPNDVTIAGFSAGSSSVDLLMLSPSAKGLFNKVIPEGGANLAPWSVQIDPLENAKNFAKSVGFQEVDDIFALEEFYKSASYDLLTSTAELFWRTDVSFVFSPCVEHTSTKEEVFLKDSPYNILNSGKYEQVPILYGFTDMEGLLRLETFDMWKDKMNINFSEFLPIDLRFESEGEREQVSRKIKEFYFGDKPVSNDNILSYINYISDVYFTYSTMKAVELHIKAGHDHIFLYEYNFVDDSAQTVPHTDVKGAHHSAQTIAVLDGIDMVSGDESKASDEYKKVKATLRELWINFITTGSPVPAGSSLPAWPPVREGGAPHMSLGRVLELRGALLADRTRFWDEIYARHYRAPQPPPIPPTRHTEL